jgi:acyl-CoA thioesterase-1
VSQPLQKPPMPSAIHRRALLTAAVALGLSAPALAAGKTAPPRTWTLTVLGDSVTAGLGLAGGAALPAQLQAALNRLGVKARVRAAGVSGDTTADGLARTDFSVKGDTDLCLVILGGNDLLQGVEPRVMKRNLDAILGRLQARHIPAMLVGLKAPGAIGSGYAREFDAVFPDLARARGVRLYPNLLAGVIGEPALNQGDGVHPNARGARIIAGKLAPMVAAVLKSHT